ncbi:hypothetical protein ACQ4PT_001454 [Festuca glaucescens]
MEALQKMIEKLSLDLKGGLSSMESSQASIEAKLESTQASIDATVQSLQTLNTWRGEVDTQVSDLTASVQDLRKQIDRVVVGVGLSALGPPPTTPGAAAQPAAPANTTLGTSLQAWNSGPNGHGTATDNRGQAGVTPLPTPVKGTDSSSMAIVTVGSKQAVATIQNTPPPPPTEFPRFAGEDPRLWQKAAEKYFRVFAVDPTYWVEYATMHFSGNAALWLQSVEDQLPKYTWEKLCDIINTRFDRGQYQFLYRQIFKLKQHGTVIEYLERFDNLMHHMLAYRPDLDPMFFTTRFIEGLARDIRAVVMIQRPQDLETAVALALLQEEIEDDEPKLSHKHTPVKPMMRHNFTPPGVRNTSQNSEDRSSGLASKVAALKAYRRARNLCFTCGEKWAPGHKCNTTVQLHVVEELLSMLQSSESECEPNSPEKEVFEDALHDAQEVLMSISKQAVNGSEAPRSMRLLGHIQGHDVLILIDSGSSNNFVSSKLASQLKGVTPLSRPVHVRVAGGGILSGDAEINNCKWECQGSSFHTDLRVLPLQCYDIILGMQWLEGLGLMTHHWAEKWFEFDHQGTKCKLQGIRPNTEQCETISVEELHTLQRQDSVYYMVELYTVSDTTSQSTVPHIVAMVLKTYEEVFAEPKGLPPHRSFDHTIPLLPGASPVNLRPYRYSPMQKNEIEKQIRELLAQGVIRPSSSPFASPVLLVGKKDLSWRLCVDYRHLNAITVKNKYPLPVIDELLDELAGAKWFTSLDLRSGYHQIRMAECDEYKTAFQTHHGHFEYRVMPYGVTGGPATFQGVMNAILAPFLRQSVLVFVDDILIYSKTLADHAQHLQAVLEILAKNELKVKRSKCNFAKQEIQYLGHVISASGVSTDQGKIKPILQWQPPENVKELRWFLGMTGYYRKFIRGYGVISKNLTGLLKKGVPYTWTSATEESFQALKNALSSAPVLALPDFSKTFIIETDACSRGVGAVLLQEDHPLAFISKALGPRHLGLSTYEKECLAILMAVDKWRSYLQHGEFIIRTDQRSLMHLDDKRLTTSWQHKALTKMLGLQYKIIYKKGVDNRVADALSRHIHGDTEELQVISACRPIWLEAVELGYTKDSEATQRLAQLALSSPIGNYTLHKGLIRYKGRIWVGRNPKLQQDIMHALHCSPIGGHSGFQATYHRIKHLFSWPGMKAHIRQFVAQCSVCQQAKTERVPYPGLLEPLAVPTGAWKVVTMDFITGLPKSSRYDCIMVVVDKFSRYAHFVPLSHPFTALSVAMAYMKDIYRLHSMPEAIVSDRDPIFTSTLWQELFRLTQTELRMSSARHPETDGQTERVNQCLEGFLRCFVSSCQTKWSDWIPLAEFWYNTTIHSALGKTPFEVLYGHAPRHFGVDVVESCAIPDLQQWLSERETMTALLHQHLTRQRQRMKSQADKHRTERHFDEGEWVYLKLQPYVQTSVAHQGSRKLAFRFYGPFQIIQKVGKVAYKLQLPSHSQIHPVIHVSQLKKSVGSEVVVQTNLPDVEDFNCVPEQVLGTRWRRKDATSQKQVLVRWSKLPDALATWEWQDEVQARFPGSPAWGQAGSQGEGNVTDSSMSREITPTGKQRRRLRRFSRRPARVVGPEWTT